MSCKCFFRGYMSLWCQASGIFIPALFFRESAVLPSWNLKSRSLKIAVHCPNPCLVIPFFRKSSSSVVNFKTWRMFLWERKILLGRASFLGGELTFCTVSTEGPALEVESPSLAWTSSSTSDPLAPWSFCRHSWPFKATSRDRCFW